MVPRPRRLRGKIFGWFEPTDRSLSPTNELMEIIKSCFKITSNIYMFRPVANLSVNATRSTLVNLWDFQLLELIDMHG